MPIQRLMQLWLFFALLISPLLSFAQQKITICTASSVREGLFSKVEAAFEKEAGIKLEYFKSPVRQPYAYYQEMMDGKCEAALASISFEDWMGELKKANVALPAAGTITNRVVARDLQWVVVNKSNGIKKLSMSQVRDLFSGQIKNWKEVGGADLPVTLYLAGDKAAGYGAFKKMAMENREFAPGAQEIKTRDEMHTKVASTPGSMAYTALEVQADGLVYVETEPIGRPITMITKGRPSASTEKLIGFLRKAQGAK